MSDEDLHRLASLLVRDLTILAKQQYDMSRSFTALAATCRQVLAAARGSVLGCETPQDSKVGAPTVSDPFGVNLEMDYDQ